MDWTVNRNGFSFVISHESHSGPGLQGRAGFVALWRPIYQNRCAIEVAGSPFRSFAEAEEACKAMLDTWRNSNCGTVSGQTLRGSFLATLAMPLSRAQSRPIVLIGRVQSSSQRCRGHSVCEQQPVVRFEPKRLLASWCRGLKL